jgi:hypothetical protein
MQQHELDPVSLVAGLVFGLVAGAYAITHTTGVRLHWLLILPAVLILIGAAMLSIAVRRMRAPTCVEPPADVQ